MNVQRRQQKMMVQREKWETTGPLCKFWNQNCHTHKDTLHKHSHFVVLKLYCQVGTHTWCQWPRDTDCKSTRAIKCAEREREQEREPTPWLSKKATPHKITSLHLVPLCNTYIPCKVQAPIWVENWSSSEVDGSWHVLLHIFCTLFCPPRHLWSSSPRLCDISTGSANHIGL